MVIQDSDLVGGRAGRLPGSKGDARAHKAMEAMNDAKIINNSGTDAIDQVVGLSTSLTANATYATSSLGCKVVRSRSEPFNTDETTSYNKLADPVIFNKPTAQ